MWKKNPLGGYELTPTKGGSVKEKNPIRSGWYPHPKTKQVIWYDAETNTFHDKIRGPARATLSVGWKLSGGKDAEDLTRMTIQGAKKIIPALWKYDKARRRELGEMMDTSFAYYKKELRNLLVSDRNPDFVNPTDKTKQSTVTTTTETKVKKPKVPELFKSERIDYSDIKFPENKKIVKDLDEAIEKQKAILWGNAQ